MFGVSCAPLKDVFNSSSRVNLLSLIGRMCECVPNFLSRTCRECGLCLSVGLVKVGFMGNIPSAELCEEKIDYPERLPKQEKETGWS